MSITIDLPPTMKQEIESYETVRGAKIETVLLGLLAKEFAQWREAKKVRDYLMSQSGWLPKDYVFDREEANEG